MLRLSLFLMCVGNNSCGEKYTDDWKGELVTSPGTFLCREKKVLLNVNITENSIISYQLSNEQGDVLIKSKERMSNAMLWGLVLDKKDRFWALSSDIGNHVWIRDSLGIYQQHLVKNDIPVPEEVYDFMPSSIKICIRLKNNLHSDITGFPSLSQASSCAVVGRRAKPQNTQPLP